MKGLREYSVIVVRVSAECVFGVNVVWLLCERYLSVVCVLCWSIVGVFCVSVV